MNVSVICFTARGCDTALRIRTVFDRAGDTVRIWCKKKDYTPPEGIRSLEEPLKEWTGKQFGCRDALIFVGATGITVRSVAPFLEHKTKDPAVLTVDEQGKFVISLLSGHIGGANELCSRIAEELKATPVITTATDLNRTFAVDVFAKKNRLWIADMTAAKRISALLLDGGCVEVSSAFPVEGKLPEGLRMAPPEDAGKDDPTRNRTLPEADARIRILAGAVREGREADGKPELLLVPQRAVLGLGCRRGKSAEELEAFVLGLLEKQNLSVHALEKVCSIDRKAKEPGILQFCGKYGLPFETFPAEELMAVSGTFPASPFVQKQVGADNVCERSAVLGSKNGTLLVRKTAENGMTAAVAWENGRICFE